MKKTLILAALAASTSALAVPAQAAFYLEGLMPYTEAPNCNDPYATTCGRYGSVPHEGEVEPPKPSHLKEAPKVHEMPKQPAPRYHTREGLEK